MLIESYLHKLSTQDFMKSSLIGEKIKAGWITSKIESLKAENVQIVFK